MTSRTEIVADADTLRKVVSRLIEQSGCVQRELAGRVGLSKDQLSRALKGQRPLSLAEALALLAAAGLPSRGALMLVILDRADLASAWTASGLAAFIERLVTALPEALESEIDVGLDRVDPRWGPSAARFIAKRIAHHIRELTEREERLGEFSPSALRPT